MRHVIVLRGDGADAEAAADWAGEQARQARYTRPAAERFALRVRAAYEEACRALMAPGSGPDGAFSMMRLSLGADCMTPRFAMVEGGRASSRLTPRAVRAIDILGARAARKTMRERAAVN